jgi:SAM-dependent methyltransferase
LSSNRALYGSTIFCSAFLLFLIEPIAAKEILPSLGGSSAVWMTCLVFFQAMLLGGYLYAHWLTRPDADNKFLAIGSSRIHLLLVAAASLLTIAQLTVHPNLTHAAEHPASAIFLDLTGTIGLPFLLLACSSPLLQVWFARRENTAIPYRLFGLSNSGSLLALILYPIAIEPYLTLRHQKLVWSVCFVIVAVLHGLLAHQNNARALGLVPESSNTGTTAIDPAFALSDASSPKKKLLWFLLPMAAAMQLSAVTGFLSQNIAAIPLLWILPLVIYLLTFIAAFDAPLLYRRGLMLRFLVVLIAALGFMLSKTDMSLPIGLSLAFFLIELFFGCYFLHAETYAIRPKRHSEATLFYLMIAAGGVAGSFFIGVASPLLFDANYDIAISFAATAAAALVVVWSGNSIANAHERSNGKTSLDNRDALWPQRLLWMTATVLMFSLIFLMYRSFNRDSLVLVRNFYGSLSVRQSHNPPIASTVRSLQNGSIQHGTQWFAPEFRSTPTTYYAQNSGVGLALQYCCFESGSDVRTLRPKTVGIIGLGAGTLAAYGKPGDQFTFYEINPGVQPIARNLFTYIRDSAAQVKVLEGDARITLEHQPPQNYDVLVVDAFSGDAIPLHLLTREAIAVYRRHLAPGGVLAFHVSNQYLDLAPEVALLAASQGMQAASIQSLPNEQEGAFSSTWILVTDNLEFLKQPQIAKVAKPIVRKQTRSALAGQLRLWTDDYSSLLPILQWRGR